MDILWVTHIMQHALGYMTSTATLVTKYGNDTMTVMMVVLEI